MRIGIFILELYRAIWLLDMIGYDLHEDGLREVRLSFLLSIIC